MILDLGLYEITINELVLLHCTTIDIKLNYCSCNIAIYLVLVLGCSYYDNRSPLMKYYIQCC